MNIFLPHDLNPKDLKEVRNIPDRVEYYDEINKLFPTAKIRYETRCYE